MLDSPKIEYISIKINNKEIGLSGTAKASFVAPFNEINITMKPLNCSLSYYEARVTAENADWDIGVGTRVYVDTSIEANKNYTFSIPVNSTNFSLGDITYRISLYGRSAIDDSWDVSYVFFVLGTGAAEKFVPADSDDYEVLTTREALAAIINQIH